MCLVGYRRRSSLVSFAAAALVLDDRNVNTDESTSTQVPAAKDLIRPTPMTDEFLSNAKRTFDDHQESSEPLITRQVTNSPEPSSYKKRKPSFVDGVDEEIKNSTSKTSSSAFLLSFPVDADSTIAADTSDYAAPPSKRARTLAFRKSSTLMTYESIKSSLFSCDMLPPSI